MTGYVVHYRDGVSNWTESVSASSTSSLFSSLLPNITYSFFVEATSEHFSGISSEYDIKLSNVSFTTSPPDMPASIKTHEMFTLCLISDFNVSGERSIIYAAVAILPTVIVGGAISIIVYLFWK